jgi:hypothetical protein
MIAPLLLLHKRHTPDDAAIWREAIRRGWNTVRTDLLHVEEDIKDRDVVRYYGNTLHAHQISAKLPFWFSVIFPKRLTELGEYTKRKIELISFENLGQPLKQTAFIKPVNDKWFEARVYKEGEVITGAPIGSDQIYVSEIVKFVDEVRCFVLGDKILTASLYRINGQVWDITGLPPDEINFDDRIDSTPIPEYVKAIRNKCHLPYGIVMDFGRLENGEWSLIEFNEAYASGLYYCAPDKAFDAIINSQIDIPSI